MKELIMPLVALVGGLISLFVDSKDKGKRGLFVFVFIATALLTILFNVQESDKKDIELKNANKEKDETRRVLLNITEQTKEVPNLVLWLKKFGFTEANAKVATPDIVNKAFDANALYNQYLKQFSQRLGSDVTVEYFPKDVDGEKVFTAIRNAGLKVVEKRPVRDEATNSIWVGDEVPTDDWKLVSFVLLRAGVNLVSIRPFRDGTGSKAKLIQVGADASLIGQVPLTSSQIATMPSLSR